VVRFAANGTASAAYRLVRWRHRVRQPMTKLGLAPIYQRAETSEPHPRHRIWPSFTT